MGTYDVNVNGFDLKVRVVDRAEIISQGVFELRDQITSSIPIVGINIFSPKGDYEFPFVQLCVGNRCLVVMSYYVNLLLTCLKDFLDDPNICFVGCKMDLAHSKYNQSVCFSNNYEHQFARGVDVRDLAARVLQKTNLLSISRLKVVASEAGSYFDDSGDYNALRMLSSKDCVFSIELVICLASYPHATYLLGQILLSSF